MKLLQIIALLIFTLTFSCGFRGNQKVSVSDSEHQITHDGESFTYIVIRIEFIDQVRELCEDLHPLEEFETELERKQVVAECTLDGIAIFDINFDAMSDFLDTACTQDPEIIEGSEDLSQDDINSIDELCSTFNY